MLENLVPVGVVVWVGLGDRNLLEECAIRGRFEALKATSLLQFAFSASCLYFNKWVFSLLSWLLAMNL